MGVKAVLCGVLVEEEEHKQQLLDAFKKEFGVDIKLVGHYHTLPGHDGEGGRSDAVIEFPDEVIGKAAVHQWHLSGMYRWADDFLKHSRDLVPEEALTSLFGDNGEEGPSIERMIEDMSDEDLIFALYQGDYRYMVEDNPFIFERIREDAVERREEIERWWTRYHGRKKIQLRSETHSSGITRGEFEAYEDVRSGGLTNMYHLSNVEALSGLSREKIRAIMDHYGALAEFYPGVRV